MPRSPEAVISSGPRRRRDAQVQFTDAIVRRLPLPRRAVRLDRRRAGQPPGGAGMTSPTPDPRPDPDPAARQRRRTPRAESGPPHPVDRHVSSSQSVAPSRSARPPRRRTADAGRARRHAGRAGRRARRGLGLRPGRGLRPDNADYRRDPRPHICCAGTRRPRGWSPAVPTAPEPAAAYQVPVTARTCRLGAAAGPGHRVGRAAAWRVVIGSTDDTELRSYALAGLSDAAVRLATWKQIAGVNPATVPFPRAVRTAADPRQPRPHRPAASCSPPTEALPSAVQPARTIASNCSVISPIGTSACCRTPGPAPRPTRRPPHGRPRRWSARPSSSASANFTPGEAFRSSSITRTPAASSPARSVRRPSAISSPLPATTMCTSAGATSRGQTRPASSWCSRRPRRPPGTPRCRRSPW